MTHSSRVIGVIAHVSVWLFLGVLTITLAVPYAVCWLLEVGRDR